MAKISGTGSMGVKLKIFSEYENVSPHVSITVERNTPDFDDAGAAKSDMMLVQEAAHLAKLCRDYVASEIEKDIKLAKQGKDTKYAGKKLT